MSKLSIPNDIVDGALIEASEHQQNYKQIESFVNDEVIHADGSVAMDAGAELLLGKAASVALGAVTKAQLDGFLPLSGGTVTGDLQVDGNVNVAKRVVASQGSTAAPSFAFVSNTKTGVTGHPDGDRIYNVVDGVWKTIIYDSYFRVADDLQVEGQTKAQNGTNAAPAYSFTSDPNTGVYRPAADALELVVGGERAVYFGKSTNSSHGVYMPLLNTRPSPPAAYPSVMVMDSSAGGMMVVATSARRHLGEVESVNRAAINSVYDLAPVWYRSKSEAADPAHSFYGFVAEDVAAVDPRLVTYSTDEDGTATPETVNDHAVMALLVSAVKTQRDTIAELSARVEALEGQKGL